MAGPAILVVEDDPTLERAIARNLDARGYTSVPARTVALALEAVRRRCPALVLLDIDLPDGSGWEVLRTLRATGYDALPVVVMSASRPNLRLAHELRCAAVLEKPFPMQSLLRLAAESTGQTPPVPGDAGLAEKGGPPEPASGETYDPV